MSDIITAFITIGLPISLGYIVGRTGLLGEAGQQVLVRLSFFVLAPVMMFTVLSRADVGVLFSAQLPVNALVAVFVVGVYMLLSRLVFKRSAGEALIGGLSAGYVNANNIGLPISLFLLGNAAYPTPVLLLQLLVFTPIALAVLDAGAGHQLTAGRRIWQVVRNPLLIAAVLGMVISLTGLDLPTVVADPLSVLAGAYIPVILISFGMSLHGQRVLGARGRRIETLSAVVLKLVVMPVLAWVLSAFVFRLPAAEVLAAVVIATLPTAQNVPNFAHQYGVGTTISRDVTLITTIACAPALVVVYALLH